MSGVATRVKMEQYQELRFKPEDGDGKVLRNTGILLYRDLKIQCRGSLMSLSYQPVKSVRSVSQPSCKSSQADQ
jgi:hypothetical protein